MMTTIHEVESGVSAPPAAPGLVVVTSVNGHDGIDDHMTDGHCIQGGTP